MGGISFTPGWLDTQVPDEARCLFVFVEGDSGISGLELCRWELDGFHAGLLGRRSSSALLASLSLNAAS